jgi:hypothetical protein
MVLIKLKIKPFCLKMAVRALMLFKGSVKIKTA